MSGQLTGPYVRRWSRTIAALLLLLGPAAAAGQPYRVGGAVTRPEIVLQTKPAYTEMARKARLQGTVILEAVIDEQGNVTDVRVLKGLPMGLEQAATEAVEAWKFKPATLDGKPVAVYYVLTINFQVEGPAYQGPAFAAFLREHPDFAAALTGKRYDEAAALLDRWSAQRPADAEIGLARTYLLLQQDLLEDGWQVAQTSDGAHRDEVLRAVALYALSVARRSTLDSLTRAEAVELGLAATTLALEAQPDAFEVMLDKSSLLSEKAAQTSDEDEGRRLRDEADRLRTRAAKVREAGLVTSEEPEAEEQDE